MHQKYMSMLLVCMFKSNIYTKKLQLFQGKIIGYDVDPLTSLDIDSINDLKIIKSLIK